MVSKPQIMLVPLNASSYLTGFYRAGFGVIKKVRQAMEFARMKRYKGTLYVIIVVFFASFMFPLNLHSMFFKYLYKDGKLVFVDDIGKVPPEYREDVEIYQEKYDHLHEEERSILLEKDRQESKMIQETLMIEEKYLNAIEIQKKAEREQIAKEKYLKSI